LKNPIYEATASYGHFGNRPYTQDVVFLKEDGSKISEPVEFFGWEKLDAVGDVKEMLNI
jgi:S-adenosylmethionine synthetase